MHEAHEGFCEGTLNTLSLEGEGRVSEESASLISCLFFVKNAPTLIRPPATFSLIGRRKIVARTRNELSGEGRLFQPSSAMHTESPEQQSQEHNAACQISGEMDCENRMAKASNTACTIQDPHPKIKTQPGHNEFALRFATPYFFCRLL